MGRYFTVEHSKPDSRFWAGTTTIIEEDDFHVTRTVTVNRSEWQRVSDLIPDNRYELKRYDPDLGESVPTGETAESCKARDAAAALILDIAEKAAESFKNTEDQWTPEQLAELRSWDADLARQEEYAFGSPDRFD